MKTARFYVQTATNIQRKCRGTPDWTYTEDMFIDFTWLNIQAKYLIQTILYHSKRDEALWKWPKCPKYILRTWSQQSIRGWRTTISRHGWDNRLMAPNRRRAISWNNAGLVYSRMYGFGPDRCQIAKSLGSTSIRHRSDAFASDRCLIEVDPRLYAIWDEVYKWHTLTTKNRSKFSSWTTFICWRIQRCHDHPHDDVMPWTPFLHYWPFVRGIRRLLSGYQYKGSVM